MKSRARHERYKPRVRLEEVVTFICDNGECYLESASGVAGIEINFKGNATITPQLPEGWILQGNSNKIIIFTLENKMLQNQLLFTYEGIVEIVSVIACNNKAERYSETFRKSALSWGSSNWSMDIEGNSWENFKDNRRKGKVKRTTYNLPDYNLPEVKPNKKTKKRVQRRSSTGGY
jgi:hypothetical protein